jgi:hypothetical protein
VTLPGVEETRESMIWHERVGRWPIRMHDMFPQHYSRGPLRRQAR